MRHRRRPVVKAFFLRESTLTTVKSSRSSGCPQRRVFAHRQHVTYLLQRDCVKEPQISIQKVVDSQKYMSTQ